MKKTHKVVMLPTKQKAQINLNDYRVDKPTLAINYSIPHYDTNPYELIRDRGYTPQHLYIILDDEIKEGDWCIDINENIVCKCINTTNNGLFEHSNGRGHQIHITLVKKIVATTDKSISNPYNAHGNQKALGEIHESFILAYMKAYNEGKPIIEVDLEMITICTNCGQENCDRLQCRGHEDISIIKTRPDNTVIIHQSKLYTKEEIYLLAAKVVNDIAKNRGNADWNMFTTPKMIVDEWIDNL